MYLTAAKLKKLYFIIRLNKAFGSDLFWWHIFLLFWNGFSILRHSTLLTTPDFVAQTDASGTWGCAAVLGSRWFQWQWPLNGQMYGSWQRNWFQSYSLVSLGNTRYVTVTSISSVIMNWWLNAWLLLSAKAPHKIQLWCTFYVLCGFSSHTLTSPLQLHTYLEQWTQLLIKLLYQTWAHF